MFRSIFFSRCIICCKKLFYLFKSLNRAFWGTYYCTFLPIMCETEEEIINWKAEAEAVIYDVGFAVKSISISSILPSSPTEIFLNIETREDQKLCVELSSYGFRVVSEHFDEIHEDYQDQTYYETPYALLNKYSSQFIECFATALKNKLNRLT